MQYVGTNQQHAATVQAANLTYANQTNINNQKAGQLDEAKSQNAEDTAIASAKAQGAVSASASDQGLGSASISQQLHADMFGIGRQASIADLNDSNARAQIANEQFGDAIDRDATIAKSPKGSLIGLGLGVGSAVLSGVGAYGSAKKAGT